MTRYKIVSPYTSIQISVSWNEYVIAKQDIEISVSQNKDVNAKRDIITI